MKRWPGSPAPASRRSRCGSSAPSRGCEPCYRRFRVSDVEFERRVSAALHTPVPTEARAKHAIMQRVREIAADGSSARRDLRLVPRRTMRYSLVGLALAAGIGSITTPSSLLPPSPVSGSSDGTAVIGDTVVSALRDTLRLVRLMFDDPAARRVT